MISTVSTSTLSPLASAAAAGSLGLIAFLTLVALLVEQALASSMETRRLNLLVRVLNVGIIPLLIAFVLMAAGKFAVLFR